MNAADTKEAIRCLLQDAALAALKANRHLSEVAQAAIGHGLTVADVTDEIEAIRNLMVTGTPALNLTSGSNPQANRSAEAP